MSKSEPDPADVGSIDAIIRAAYDVISGSAGKKRDWNRERSLFYPGARIIPTASVPGRNDVDLEPQMLDVEGYIVRAEALFEKAGFYEKEIARRVEQFGQIAHVLGMHRDVGLSSVGMAQNNMRSGLPFHYKTGSLEPGKDLTRFVGHFRKCPLSRRKTPKARLPFRLPLFFLQARA